MMMETKVLWSLVHILFLYTTYIYEWNLFQIQFKVCLGTEQILSALSSKILYIYIYKVSLFIVNNWQLFNNSETWEFFLWSSLAYGEIPPTKQETVPHFYICVTKNCMWIQTEQEKQVFNCIPCLNSW
jgi:hypothetical protein